jgi:hypothetical protein
MNGPQAILFIPVDLGIANSSSIIIILRSAPITTNKGKNRNKKGNKKGNKNNLD